MGRGDVWLVRVLQDERCVRYSAHSLDFAKTLGDKPLIGYLDIDVANGTYEFQPDGEFAGVAFVPPAVFELAAAERDRLRATRYRDFSGALHSARIAAYARAMLQAGSFPLSYPPPHEF